MVLPNGLKPLRLKQQILSLPCLSIPPRELVKRVTGVEPISSAWEAKIITVITIPALWLSSYGIVILCGDSSTPTSFGSDPTPGRSDVPRTRNLLVPSQAIYQIDLRPVIMRLNIPQKDIILLTCTRTESAKENKFQGLLLRFPNE